MRFSVLGALQVVGADGPVPLGGPKQRIVLAHLLLRAGETVPTERLIALVWADDPPAAARSTLRGYISHLRHALGISRLQRQSQGYVLHAEPEEIDARRFEELTVQGRRLVHGDPTAAVRLLTEGLALWRGPALDDLAGHPTLQPEISRLEELRQDAVERRIAARMRLGQHRELVGDLKALLRADPLRERLWEHLIIALYRSGRQAEALSAYRHARDILREELGIEPTPALREVQARVLRQDPDLDLRGVPLRGYQLRDELGTGRSGTVYRATQSSFDRDVAVRVLHPSLSSHPDFIRTFEVRTQEIARLEHPHLARIHDAWRDPDGAYLVSQLVRGGTLRDRLLAGSLDGDVAVRTLTSVASALAAAHRAGVLHGDVRAENVLFDEEGFAFLTDFELVRTQRTDGQPHLAPELRAGSAPSTASDIYALGVLADQLLHGRGPAAAVEVVLATATAELPQRRYPDVDSFLDALRGALAFTPTELDEATRNPFKGLRAFDQADEKDFFGREKLVDRLLKRLQGGDEAVRLLAVVGPSGSGKSSVVRAGLLPAVRRGDLPGSEAWFVIDLAPGTDPFADLESGLEGIATTPLPPNLGRRLAAGGLTLTDAVRSILPGPHPELLLVIDQFEELFTQVADEATRAAFVDAIVAAVRDDDARVRVVLTLRADLYDRPLRYPSIAELLGAGTEVVPPLTAEELGRAIAGPCERAGLLVAPDLVAQLVNDVAGQPGALPLLQFALTELVDHRQDSVLDVDTYHRLGRVSGALAARAEAVYAALSASEQLAVRPLFLRLVTVREGLDDTRRRVLRSDLLVGHDPAKDVDEVIGCFGRARLLTFDRDPHSRGPTVEVAHEALLREWGRLRDWVESARVDLAVGDRLAVATREWLEAHRDPSLLASASRLERFEAWESEAGLPMTPQQQEFLAASRLERDRREADERTRVARERDLEQRAVRRLRALVALFAVLGLVASGLTMAATSQSRRADRAARIASAREFAAASRADLDNEPERSIMLAMAAVEHTRRVDGTVLPEAEEALHEAVVTSRTVLTVPGIGGIVAWSPEGSLFTTEGPEDTGLVELRDARTGELVDRWVGHDIDVNAVAFDPTGGRVASAGDDGFARLWDVRTGELLSEVGMSDGGAVWGPSFSADGERMAAAWAETGLVRVWETTSEDIVLEVEVSDGPDPTSLSADGRFLAVGRQSDPVPLVFDVGTGEEAIELAGHAEGGLWAVAFSPDGRWLASAGADQTVRVWDAGTGELRQTLSGGAGVMSVAWSPDMATLATGGTDGSVSVWSVTEGSITEAHTLPSHPSGAYGLSFAPDGEHLLIGDTSVSQARIVALGLAGSAEWTTIPSRGRWEDEIAFSPAGDLLLTEEEGIAAWDPTEARRLGTTVPSANTRAFALSPDGQQIALLLDGDDVVRLHDAFSGELVRRVGLGHEVAQLAWSPDSRRLAAGGDGVTIVQLETDDEVTLDLGATSDVRDLAFGPDGRQLAIVTNPADREVVFEVRVRVVELEGHSVTTEIAPGEWVHQVAFSPDGRYLTFGRLPSTWDAATGERVATHESQTGAVFPVAASPDGTRVATGSTDGTVTLLDPAGLRRPVVLRGHAGMVIALAFDAQGRRLASASIDGTVRVWALDLDDLLTIAAAKLTRSPTEAECRQYAQLPLCTGDR